MRNQPHRDFRHILIVEFAISSTAPPSTAWHKLFDFAVNQGVKVRRSKSDHTGAGILIGLVIIGSLIKAAIDWLIAHPFISGCILVGIACFVSLKLWTKWSARKKAIRIQQEAIRLQEELLDTARSIVSEHAAELSIRRKQLTYKLNYGLMDDTRWQDEIDFFIENKIANRIGDVRNTPERLYRIQQIIVEATAGYSASRIPFTREMDPLLYEHLVADTLRDLGWNARLTKGSGDQGVDVIAAKAKWRVVIQCKRYSRAIGNSAVQEVLAGMAFEKADWAVVVSNAGYTKSARQLADSAGVILLHHDELATLWSRISDGMPLHPKASLPYERV